MSGSEPLLVGVVGCGMIAQIYLAGSPGFDTWRPVACADLDLRLAEAFAAQHGLRPAAVDELVAGTDVDLVLNLTPPTAHAEVTRAALEAGKHVYTEKPLATTVEEGRALVDEAERRGLRLGCAPDTFLGSAYQEAKRLIDEGAIGVPIGAAAELLVGGPDLWHPNAAMFYRQGGGPLLDLAPYYLTATVALLGPIESVAGFATTPTPIRTLGAGPLAGHTIDSEVPTHAAAVLRMRQGALVTLTVSFEARNQYASGMEVYGTEASLLLPNANEFGGCVSVRTETSQEEVRFENLGARETRGLGLDDLAESLREGRPHRASGDLALHVLAAADAVSRSETERRAITLG